MAEPEQSVKYAEANVAFNLKRLDFCKSVFSAAAGIIAGVLGLTGLAGFSFYFLSSLALSGVFLACKPLLSEPGMRERDIQTKISLATARSKLYPIGSPEHTEIAGTIVQLEAKRMLETKNSKQPVHFKSGSEVFTAGLFGCLLSYVLFWTFTYGLQHVYE